MDKDPKRNEIYIYIYASVCPENAARLFSVVPTRKTGTTGRNLTEHWDTLPRGVVCGVSLTGNIQEPSGLNPVPCALG